MVDVDEVRRLRDQLERAICELLERFEWDTGVRVEAICTTVTPAWDHAGVKAARDVTVTLERL